MKIYFVCPYLMTGGPECLHQWCDMINTLGCADAYMYYTQCVVKQAETLYDDSPILYTEKYKNIKRSLEIEDFKENMVFYPNLPGSDAVTNARIVIACLGIPSFTPILGYIYVFQSFGAKQHLLSISKDIEWFDIDDYIHDMYVSQSYQRYPKSKVITYNILKDHITPTIMDCNRLVGRPVLPTETFFGNTAEEVIEKLKKSIIYSDLGNHLGRDRIPREAALLGCVVVVMNNGTAKYKEDVPLSLVAKDVKEAYDMIQKALEEPEKYLKEQEIYVEAIRGLKDKCAKQIYAFCKRFGPEQIILDTPKIDIISI